MNRRVLQFGAQHALFAMALWAGAGFATNIRDFPAPPGDERAGEAAAPGARISPEAARSLQAKIRLLSASPPGKPASFQPIVVTEVETNSYLKYDGRGFLPPGVNDPEIRITPECIYGTADVDFGQLNQASKTEDWGAKALAMAFPG